MWLPLNSASLTDWIVYLSIWIYISLTHTALCCLSVSCVYLTFPILNSLKAQIIFCSEFLICWCCACKCLGTSSKMCVYICINVCVHTRYSQHSISSFICVYSAVYSVMKTWYLVVFGAPFKRLSICQANAERNFKGSFYKGDPLWSRCQLWG